MEITEVRIKLMEDNSGSNERLQAFCSITFDDMFVIRDLKIIEGAKGFFVAMPSRKLTDRCHPLRHQEPPAQPVLQPVRQPARREPRHPRRRRPRQAARRHRPPDQLDVPREDPGGGARLLRRRARTRPSCPATSRATTTSTAEYDVPVETAGARAGRRPAASPRSAAGPLRGHTQHTRGGQSVLRGPHVSPRKEGSRRRHRLRPRRVHAGLRQRSLIRLGPRSFAGTRRE